MKFDLSTLDACKTSIVAILSTPKGADPSGVDYLLANEWGGYRLAYFDKFGFAKGKQFALIPHFPGLDGRLFDQAARELLEEGKIVQYAYTPQWKGVSMQVVAGLPGREAEFFPKHAA